MGSKLSFAIFYEIPDLYTCLLRRPSVRDVCVYTLLYTESGRTLLNIIGTGVDTIEKAIASQGRFVHDLNAILSHYQNPTAPKRALVWSLFTRYAWPSPY